MKPFLSCLLVLGFLLVTPFLTADPPADAKYAELFAYPAKITLDDKQKEKFADLVKEYEPRISAIDKSLATPPQPGERKIYDGRPDYRHQLIREFTIKKNAILTEAQRKALNIKFVIPDCVQEKALSDPKVWDIGQLEKHFTVLSRSYSPEEQLVTFVVITKKKWTEKERSSDAANWNSGKVKAVFYNKDEELLMSLSCHNNKNYTFLAQIIRTEPRLTEKEAEDGLVKFRIKIDLAPGRAGEVLFADAKKAASVKLIYPEPTQ